MSALSERLRELAPMFDAGSVGTVAAAAMRQAAARIESLENSYANARDAILNGRGALEAVLDNDQTNAVLAELDDAFPPSDP